MEAPALEEEVAGPEVGVAVVGEDVVTMEVAHTPPTAVSGVNAVLKLVSMM